jgi:hypothetical protein
MERRRMGWDLGRGKISTVGVAHPRFQYIYLYTVNRQSRTQLSKVDCCRRLHNVDDNYHAVTCVVLRFAFSSIEREVGTGTRDYFVFIPLRLVTQ